MEMGIKVLNRRKEGMNAKTGKSYSDYVTAICLAVAALTAVAVVPHALAVDEYMSSRERKAEESRKPLVYAAEPGWTASFAGYVLGQICPPTTNVSDPRGSMFRERGFRKKFDEPYHGMDVLSLKLTPTSYRLFRISASGYFTGDREALLAEGRALLKDIGGSMGIELAPFKFEAPDGSYWPKSNMSGPSGPIPKKYPVDESQWSTSRHVFAFSYTVKGSVRVDVNLGIVHDKRLYVCMSILDSEIQQTAEAEFDKAFRAAHNGQSYDEWNKANSLRHLRERELKETDSSTSRGSDSSYAAENHVPR